MVLFPNRCVLRGFFACVVLRVRPGKNPCAALSSRKIPCRKRRSKLHSSKKIAYRKFDGIVKSQNLLESVIPAKAGIQKSM
jgi:hypothetical protein